ncbi:MAG: serine/threonine-protein kinase, partial [Planctomycetota bacterium]
MSQSAEKSIFLNALDIDATDQREAYLRTACGENVDLRASVDALLSAHQQTLNPLDQPVVQEGAVQIDQMDPTTDLDFGKPSDDLGKTIGAYRLMELIGEGGFGLVYGAQQERPVKRRVALKIIKPGTGSDEVLARFDAERQAVAMMDHPNIAQVFDAGQTEDARPYFVMELVRGVPITEFCQQTSLSLEERIDLFIDVCSAVHHAHQKGVIHRDLKPSNVLVTLHDTKPVAKVIDFGVAKAMGQNLTDQTIYTRLYSMVGTPLYMSPEQASMSALDVDTRSDIYSLGVMLYELLTGTTPFDRKRLDTVGYDEMRRIIQEEEPPKPSVRKTTIDKRRGETLEGATRTHHREPGKVSRQSSDPIPSDLDWIVMKAMEKDRARRYESAAEMAADLRRFLAQEPIEARPPSRVYLASKFARRHSVAIATGSIVALALILGTVTSLYQAKQAIDAKNAAEKSQKDAELAKAEVENFADRLKDANSLIGTARSYEDRGQWSAAHSAYTEAVDLVPNYYLLWVQRGKLFIDLKLWDRAAEDYSEAIRLDAPLDGPQWQGVPALFALTDRTEDLRAVQSMLLKPTKESDRAINWSVIRGCVAAPSDSIDYQLLAETAERLMREQRGPKGPGAPKGGGRGGPGPGMKDLFSGMMPPPRNEDELEQWLGTQRPFDEREFGGLGRPDKIGREGRGPEGQRPEGRGAEGRGPEGRGFEGRGFEGRGPEGRGPVGRGPEFRGQRDIGPEQRRPDWRGPEGGLGGRGGPGGQGGPGGGRGGPGGRGARGG